MTTPTTIDTETELSAVNTILGAIGQSPVTTLGTVTTDQTNTATEIANTYENPEIAFIYSLLRESNIDVQSEGWVFNTERNVEFTPDNSSKKIALGNDILRVDNLNPHDRRTDYIRKNGFLFDKCSRLDTFDSPVFLNVTYLYTFPNLPPAFKRYITYKAAGRAATQMITNPQLVSLIATQEQMARATCMEYECNQGDYNYLGLPDKSVYSSYKPYRALQR